MALTDGESGGIPATMLVSPTGGVPANNGMGMNGQDGWWVILLIILIACGGWGNNNNGYGNQPIIVSEGGGGSVQRGFDQAAVMGGIEGVQSGVYGLSTQLCNATGNIASQLCNGFAGVNATVNNGFSQAEIANNARQIANMQQAFAAQTAVTGGLENLSAQLAQCCCDNRLATCQTQNVIATEAAANRFADANNTRDIIESQNRGTQAIMDKLCQLELDNYKAQLDAKNDLIAQLRQENLYARGQASQDVQTAELRANNATVANQLLAEMRSCPIPSQPVYGTQPIFTCGGSTCGCGA